MSARSGVTVAVIGASGNVGRKIVDLLIQRKVVAPACLSLFASKKSAGKKITISGIEWTLADAEDADFEQIQLALFATESDVSRKLIPKALKAGTIVVDSSSAYRLEKDVPLIVSPVNAHMVSIKNKSLYAIANCVASPVATVIAPLNRAHKIKRVVASTYQSVSGAGRKAMDELVSEMQAVLSGNQYHRTEFGRQIAFNLIPQIDRFMEDGFTYEEFKIMREIQKIVGGNFSVTATAVRVPIFVGHSVSLGVEFEKDVEIDEIKRLLEESASIKMAEDYMTPIEVENYDDVFVGRVRKDPSTQHGIQLWICSDNLRRGAATDVVEVAEIVIHQLNDKVK